MVRHVEVLAHDSMEGRRTGTPGVDRARTYVLAEIARTRLEPFTGGFRQPFNFADRRDTTRRLEGVNIVGRIRGTEFPDRYIVLTAHYDHLGYGRAVNGDSLYNGADDNASGTGALLALASYFSANPPRNSIIFAALDAEELGLQGAAAFVRTPPVPSQSIIMNVNLDMISRNDRNELYAVGSYAWPVVGPYIASVQPRARVSLRTGHEGPNVAPADDWTNMSDQGPFNRAGIPFIYFGVEDHPDYHRPSDTFGNIQPDFYVRAVETVLDVLHELDRNLDPVAAVRRSPPD
jgi:Zn-dependent M28 family amino/carboxypeptidase